MYLVSVCKRETSGNELEIKEKPTTVLTGLVTLLAMIHVLAAVNMITVVTLQ